MASLRRHEGYLLLDHRESPALTEQELRAVTPVLPPGAGRGVFEAPTITCSHCQVVVVINPSRTRERAYCAKCDHYICDTCGRVMTRTGICRPFTQIADELLAKASKENRP